MSGNVSGESWRGSIISWFDFQFGNTEATSKKSVLVGPCAKRDTSRVKSGTYKFPKGEHVEFLYHFQAQSANNHIF